MIARLAAAPQSCLAVEQEPSAKEAAPIELTGTWVSVINEDWRWRMLTPPKGDYTSVPLSDEGAKVANQWDPARAGSCEAFGATGLMRMPIRVRITWESGFVLKIESEAGAQVRRLYFRDAPLDVEKTRQGRSIASWDRPQAPGDGFGFGSSGPPPAGGSLKVVTTDLRAAWLRRNGVPSSENARVTEYYDRFASPDGSEWFVVTTIVEDRQYLTEPFITSSHFRKEPHATSWKPRPCRE